MQPIIDGIIHGVYQTTFLEWIAVTTGIMSVWFSLRENILVYPAGIISVLIYVYFGFTYKLYADMGVNFYYFLMSVYGWYNWTNTHDENREQIPVTLNSPKENLQSILLLLGSFLVLLGTLKFFTDSDVPFWDAATTAFAILGMWLMAKKKLESWIAWIITDLVSIPLYYYKELTLTSFQFLIFTFLAFGGYVAWKKSYQKEQRKSDTSHIFT